MTENNSTYELNKAATPHYNNSKSKVKFKIDFEFHSSLFNYMGD